MTGLQMKYFVLSPTKDDAYGRASRGAIREYAWSIWDTNRELAVNLMNWVINIEETRDE